MNADESLNAALPVRHPDEPAREEFAPLLSEPFARGWPVAGADAAAGRTRLMQRLAVSQAAESAMTTVRRRRAPRQTVAPGVTVQELYRAAADRPSRPGEPLRARLVELAPGAQLLPQALGETDGHREWLLIAGSARLDGRTLSQRDYHVVPAGRPSPAWHSVAGALIFLRESSVPARPGDMAHTVRDAEAGWPDFAPGVQRRVLWHRDGQAALLYYAQPGASVPRHEHGHDEECLMLQGEFFLDDLLLQPGDYQLAPAGTGHHVTSTDTGVVIYAHGDLELRFVA